MSNYKTFSDLKVWQKSRDLVNAIHSMEGTSDAVQHTEIFTELRNRSIAVSTAIAVGQNMRDDYAFFSELTNAWKDLSRLEALLELGLSLDFYKAKDLKPVQTELKETMQLTGGFRKYFSEKIKEQAAA